jgi:hypothetical protein
MMLSPDTRELHNNNQNNNIQYSMLQSMQPPKTLRKFHAHCDTPWQSSREYRQ